MKVNKCDVSERKENRNVTINIFREKDTYIDYCNNYTIMNRIQQEINIKEDSKMHE